MNAILVVAAVGLGRFVAELAMLLCGVVVAMAAGLSGCAIGGGGWGVGVFVVTGVAAGLAVRWGEGCLGRLLNRMIPPKQPTPHGFDVIRIGSPHGRTR